MRNVFRQIPEPLQKQILYRIGCGTVMLLLSIILICTSVDTLSVLSCVAIAVFCAATAFSLFYKSVMGDFVVISGECLNVTLTAVRKHTKMITIHTDDGKTLKVMIKQRLKKIRSGARVTLYIAANMPVYEKEDAYFLYSYLAIETKGGK